MKKIFPFILAGLLTACTTAQPQIAEIPSATFLPITESTPTVQKQTEDATETGTPVVTLAPEFVIEIIAEDTGEFVTQEGAKIAGGVAIDKSSQFE